MTQPRRSLRHIATCPQIPNIFTNNQLSQDLINLIPSSVLKQVGYHRFISCDFIERLPTFTMDIEPEGELQGVRLAASHQLEWQSSFIPADYQQQLIEDDQFECQSQCNAREERSRRRLQRETRRKETEWNIWSDPQFLQRLNDFIMGKIQSAKSLTQPGSLLQN